MDTTALEQQRNDNFSAAMDIIALEQQRKGIDKGARPSSEAELNRIDKRPRLSLSGKVCMICHCSFGDATSINIFILDLASDQSHDHGDEFVLRRPTLCLDYHRFRSDAFCVLGPKLYVFEASRALVNPRGKSVFSFDLSSIDDDSKVSRLDETRLTPLREMNYPKRYPAAARTPDGKKILVFSTLLNYNRPSPFYDTEYKSFCGDEIDHHVADEIDFELYDPLHDSWETLPGIRSLHCKDGLHVLAFAFINKSTFLIQTNIGKFTLDLGSPDRVWDSDYPFCYDDGVGYFFVIEDELLLTPTGAYDIKRDNPLSTFFEFPLSLFAHIPPKEDIRYASRCITLLDGDDVQNGKCNFCVVHAGIERPAWLPRMFVDICSIDLIKYREDKEERDSAELKALNLRTFKLALDDQPCRRLHAYNVFSMPADKMRTRGSTFGAHFCKTVPNRALSNQQGSILVCAPIELKFWASS